MRVLILHAQCASGRTAQSRRIVSGRASQTCSTRTFAEQSFFISAHDPEDGAIGVIINRPLDKKRGRFGERNTAAKSGGCSGFFLADRWEIIN